ncbi:MAG TPA: hypothetical protein VN026_07395 [Bacteroidia bacterium]|jgi:hypothetical protein|nr:hypothetical protein [Bacteroidia bacterium]
MENNSNKKMLSLATSVSMILLSASAFILSVNHTFADSPVQKTGFNIPQKTGVSSGCEIYPFGVVAGKAYWIEYNSTGWNFKASTISKWTED